MKQSISTNENKGFLKIASRRGTPSARAGQLPKNRASKNDPLALAQKSIQASRSAISKLIDATSLDDHYTLARIGPILAELRAAESILNELEPPYNA